MKFTISKRLLLGELRLLAWIAEKNGMIPALSQVLIAAGDNFLTLTATDLERTLTCRVAAFVKEHGRVGLSAQKFLKYINSLEDGDVAVSVSENSRVTIRSGRSRAIISGSAAEDFPEPVAAPEEHFTVSAATLLQLFSRTQFAIAKEESRFTLNGALLERNGNLRAVSTDGHRLSLAEAACEIGGPVAKFIISTKTISAINKLALIDDVAIHQNDTHVWFVFGDRTLLSLKLIGSFPNYVQIMPDNQTSAPIDRTELIGAISRVAQFADGETRAIRITVTGGEEGCLEIFAAAPEVGESSEAINCTWSGPNIEIGFNATYLLDFLSAVTEQKVVMYLKDNKSAVEFRPEGDEGYRYVVMPMRV